MNICSHRCNRISVTIDAVGENKSEKVKKDGICSSLRLRMSKKCAPSHYRYRSLLAIEAKSR